MDRAVGRILRRYTLTLEQWRGLSEDDKFEYLAYDYDHQEALDKLAAPFWDKVRAGESISSVETFYRLIIEGL